MDERDHYRAFADELAAENAGLKAMLAQAEQALREVEYTDDICPWCGGYRPSYFDSLMSHSQNQEWMLQVPRGHTPDCLRQAALRAIAGEP